MTYEDFLVPLTLIEKDITPTQISGGTPIVSPKAIVWKGERMRNANNAG